MGKHENKVKWCINKAKKETEQGKKHRGLVVGKPDKDKAKKHITKALTNLDVTDFLIKNKYEDWAVVSIFYAMYHSLLAALANFGYESRNQECTFAAIMSLINEGKLKIKPEKIERIKQDDSLEEVGEEPKDIISMREYSQYDIGTSIKENKVLEMKKEAQELITEIREEIGV